MVEGGEKEVKILNTLEEKTALLNAHGIKHLVVVPFNEAFSNQSPTEYVEHFLVEKFHPHTIIIGYDHRFGKNRQGDYHLLEALGERFNYRVKEIHERLINEIIISSTKVREALLLSEVTTANTLLGYQYFFSGTVIQGNKIGRTIGYPTANLTIETPEKLTPADGIYAAEILVNDAPQNNRLKGMLYIGERPVLPETSKSIEVNIFDFDEDVYGKTLTVFLHAFLRPDIKLNDLDELKQQLAKDKEAALQSFRLPVAGYQLPVEKLE